MKRTIGGFCIETEKFEEVEITRRILDERNISYEEYGDEFDPSVTFEIMDCFTLEQIKELLDTIEQKCR